MRSLLFLGIAAVLVLCTAMGEPELPAGGQRLFETHCARCHGLDGTKGKWGAKDLRNNSIPDATVLHQIRTGRGVMPSFAKKLTDEEISEVARYVRTLRK